MIVLSWNCRGLGHPRAIPSVFELVRAHKPDAIFLFETLAQTNKVEQIRIKLKFDGAFVVDQEGRSGRINILWRNTKFCHVTDYSRIHIDATITDNLNHVWRFTGFYGDFNDLLSPLDKRGRLDRPNWMIQGFRETIMECNLQDLPIIGHQLTCEHGRGKANMVEDRTPG
ncbi:uncharacterized protein [Primulina eburnea]|uniref:uncharacterized protein n=1 Tax=Primulina eburnea TaxID=1245227 RepID=UPI003C6BD84F